ncbi:MAG: 4-alpha-glucanotransferase [Clostridiales bacterium]|nr:4-alpha-glucanotransferase [Clostridiales bacterium]
MKRKSGILLHISALPTKYGIGSFGSESYEFIDYLVKSKQKIWEILPLNQTGFGDSPYSSCCSYSFNPYFISLESLLGQGLLTKKELKECEDTNKYIDYGKLYNERFAILKKAFSRFDKTKKEFVSFVKKGEYKDYALFMTLKLKFNNRGFYDWPYEFKYRNPCALKDFEKENIDDILFWQFLQYEASSAWIMLKGYAKENGIEIIGDLPLYVAYDSVDVWCNPQLFKLDDNLTPKKVAGVPPDYFSATGQLWGNPVYNYEKMSEDGYKWWVNRFVSALKYYDYVRIDHFRGFDRFYEIDYGKSDATEGEWITVPSDELFEQIHKRISKKRIIAEDLGIIDDGVIALLKKTGYPGMRVLSFAFNSEDTNPYLPQNLEENSICYTGTHDNDTLMGLLEQFSEWDYTNFRNGVKNSLKSLNIKKTVNSSQSVAKSVIELGFASKSHLFIIPMQDVALLGKDYRMNTPGREIGNWTLKVPKKCFSDKNSEYLANLTTRYKRV